MREFNAVLDERGTFARDKRKQGVRWYGMAVNPAYLPLSRVIAAGGTDGDGGDEGGGF
jgi:hypothetical protein